MTRSFVRSSALVVGAAFGLCAALGACVEPVHSVSGSGSSTVGSGASKGSGSAKPKSKVELDEQLIAAFKRLERCGYRDGRLDYRCAELKALRRMLRERRRVPAKITPVANTLAKLIGSSSEVVRLVAADSVYFYHRKRPVIAALWRALPRERAAPVEATMLRQLCWRKSVKVEHAARARLVNSVGESVAVRAEAATCLGRQRRASATTLSALRRALTSDPSPMVQGNACAALGAQRAKDALDDIISKLRTPNVDWRCATALSMIGGKKAFAALLAATGKLLAIGRLTTQQVSALSAFAPRPEVDRGALVRVFARIAATRKLSWLVRQSAARALGRLGAAGALVKLSKRYAKHKTGNESRVRLTIVAELSTARQVLAAKKAAKKKAALAKRAAKKAALAKRAAKKAALAKRAAKKRAAKKRAAKKRQNKR